MTLTVEIGGLVVMTFRQDDRPRVQVPNSTARLGFNGVWVACGSCT
jgi:hypothetical protein